LQDIVEVEIDSADSRIVYVVAGTDRLFRSTDGGEEWQHFDSTTRLNALSAVPGRPGHLYMAGASEYDRLKSNVFLSTDYGATWQARGFLLAGESKCLEVDPQQPDVVYFVSGGLRKTTDGGLTWQLLQVGQSVTCLAVDHFNSDLLYAGSSTVSRSTDGGVTWTGAGTDAGLPRQAVVESLAGDPFTPGVVYAGMAGGGIYKSTDAGASWRTVPAPVANTHVPAIVPDVAVPGAVYVLSRGTESAGVFRTGNGGLTWTRKGLPASSTSGLAVDPKDASKIYVGTSEGLARTTDAGASWKLTNPGLLSIYVYFGGGGIERGAGEVLYAWDDYRGFRSTDSAQSWMALPRMTDNPHVEYRLDKMYASPLVPGLAAATFREGLVVSGVDSDAAAGAVPQASKLSMMLTRDGGLHWTAVQGVTHVWTVLFDAVHPGRLFVRSNEGLQRSDDGGASWSRPAGSAEPYAITGLTQHPSRPDTLLALTTYDGVWRSDDAGATWTQLSGNYCWFSSLEVSPVNNNVMLAAGCGGMRSEDGGRTWNSIDLGLPENSWVSAIRFHAASGHAFLSIMNWETGGGIMRSTDGGLSWAPIAEGGSSNPFDLLVSYGQATTLWTLDQNYGVFAYTFSHAATSSARARRSGRLPSAPFETVATTAVPYEEFASLRAGVWLQSAATSASPPVGWTSFGPSSGAVGEAVVDPFNPQNVYLGSAGSHYPSEDLSYRSTDRGVSWEIWDTGSWSNLSFGASPGLMYRAKYVDLEKSTDFGESWQPLGLTMVNGATPDPYDPQIVWALRRDSIDKSTDGGATWKTLKYLYESRLVLDPKSTQIAYATGRQSYDTYATVRTMDGGETWNTTGIREAADILADPDRPGYVYLADPRYGIFKSTDDGWTWTPANEGLPRPEAWRLAYDPGERVLYCGVSASSKGTVFKSTDAAASWQPTDPSLKDTVSSLTVVTPGCLLAGAYSGVYRTADGGVTWNNSGEGLPMPAVEGVAVTQAAPDVIYIHTSAGLFRTVDAGRQWIPINPELDPEDYVVSLAAAPTDDSLVLAGTSAGVFLTRDRGDNWTRLSQGATCIAVAPDDAKTFYFTVFWVPPFATIPSHYNSAIYRSRDAGQTWVSLRIDQSAWITEPVIGPQGRLYIVQNGTLWRSTDYGDSWTRTAEVDSCYIAGSPSDPSVLYGFAEIGNVWQSRDSGETWTQVAEFQYPSTVTSLVVDPLDSDRVYIAAGDSVFLLTASQRSTRLLARAAVYAMRQIAVMPFRRVLLGAPGLFYEGLYATQIPPVDGRPRRQR